MFKKKSDERTEPTGFGELAEPTAPKPATKSQDPDVRKRNVSVIGPTLKFKGELSANEDLVIEGQIEGTIAHQEKNLTIGRQGRVNADIHASVVDILGEVEGDVRGDELVKLHKTAVVRGNLYAPRLVMEDGANFSGSIHMDRPAVQLSTATKQEALKRANLSVAETGSHLNTGGS
jgi:cytoskeletal protein CcmA (bactofilin family)